MTAVVLNQATGWVGTVTGIADVDEDGHFWGITADRWYPSRVVYKFL